MELMKYIGSSYSTVNQYITDVSNQVAPKPETVELESSIWLLALIKFVCGIFRLIKCIVLHMAMVNDFSPRVYRSWTHCYKEVFQLVALLK